MTNTDYRSITTNARKITSGILLSGIWMLCACENSNEAIVNLTGENKTILQDKAKDVKIIYSEKAHARAIIYAKEFIRHDNYTDIHKGLKVEFLNDSQQVNSTLTAKSGRIYESEGNVIVREDVIVTNEKGEQLKTDELVWNQKLEKFYTDKKVSIFTPPNQHLNGIGLEANADFSWYKIKNLKGNISIENKDFPQ